MVKKLKATATVTGNNLVLTVNTETNLEKMTRYDICVTNPIPVNGYNLPIIVEIKDSKKDDSKKDDSENKCKPDKDKNKFALVRNGLGDSVFGCNEKHSKCIVTYFNDQEKFVDLRIKENRPYCDCEQYC